MEPLMRSQKRTPLKSRENTTATHEPKSVPRINSIVCRHCGTGQQLLSDYQVALAELLQVNAILRSRLAELEASVADRESLFANYNTLKAELAEQLLNLQGAQ